MPGKYYEDLTPGQIIQHATGRTVTEVDNVLFNSLTMNTQALHLNEDFASKSQFGHRIFNGIFTMALVVGISASEVTDGTIVANLGYENVRHPAPVFHGDTIYAESEILDKRESKSRSDVGIIRMKVTGRNQNGVVVVELVRAVMFLKRDA